MMRPRIAGFKCCHSPSDLVTVMKSWPKNTPLPRERKEPLGKRRISASSAWRYSRVPPGTTGWPGMNFKVAGLGVASVWMNIVNSVPQNRPFAARFKVGECCAPAAPRVDCPSGKKLLGEARCPDEPVTAIPVDDLLSRPEQGTALCLSGGGYRAMVFHVGVLWRLYEAGLLRKLKRISSVSGGSISAGLLALKWPLLSFDPGRLESEFVPAVRRFRCAPWPVETIDAEAIVLGAILPGRISDRVANAYDEHLFERSDPAGPAGRAAICHQCNECSVGRAVALHETLYARLPRWRGEGLENSAGPRCCRFVGLSSGFVADGNATRPWRFHTQFRSRSATRTVYEHAYSSPMEACTTISDWRPLGSDIRPFWSAMAAARCRPRRNLKAIGRGIHMRVLDLVDNQVRSLRKRQVINSFKAKERADTARAPIGAFGRTLPIMSLQIRCACPVARTLELAETPTRLKRLDDELPGALDQLGLCGLRCGAAQAC